MKKFLQILGVVVLILASIFLILGLTQKKDVTIVRSTTIKAPQETVFEQVKRFKNWPHWSPWIEIEPNVKLSYFGVDGQVGSSYEWQGDEIGSGKMASTRADNGIFNFDLSLIKPWKLDASGSLKTEPGKGETKVTWTLNVHADFPRNAFNFLTEKMIGKDFENGLQNMKEYCEAHPTVELSINNVIEKEFPATNYATLRKKVKWSEIQAFSTEAFAKLAAASGTRTVGTAVTFYYTWEDSIQSAEIAPAFAVSGPEPVPGVTMVALPKSYAYTLVYKGGYGNLGRAHQILGEYLAQKGGRRLDVILEEYLSGPANEADSNNWVTNINYIVK